MKRSGHADLPLHGGRVPYWLSERMSKMGGAIVEAIVLEYGKEEVLRRLSDPFWFQSFGSVLGMDWHSSGITTSVMGALKKAITPKAQELGIYICGGKGKHSRKTPEELLKIAEKTGLDGNALVRSSKLSAKVDNTAIQDGFQLYLHSFVVTDQGDWAVIQQGMNDASGMARRYHWHSGSITSFVEQPHTFIYGQNQGLILNLTDAEAKATKSGILELTNVSPASMLAEIKLAMPRRHDVTAKDVDLKRLGAVLTLAWETPPENFENFLLINGLGPRTLQSLVLVSEVIHGTPSRFKDPARFSFAHGGKDAKPFPVPLKVYDESLNVLRTAVDKAKIGHTDKVKALQTLHKSALNLEQNFEPSFNLNEVIEKENRNSFRYKGKSIFGDAKPPADQQE